MLKGRLRRNILFDGSKQHLTPFKDFSVELGSKIFEEEIKDRHFENGVTNILRQRDYPRMTEWVSVCIWVCVCVCACVNEQVKEMAHETETECECASVNFVFTIELEGERDGDGV